MVGGLASRAGVADEGAVLCDARPADEIGGDAQTAPEATRAHNDTSESIAVAA